MMFEVLACRGTVRETQIPVAVLGTCEVCFLSSFGKFNNSTTRAYFSHPLSGHRYRCVWVTFVLGNPNGEVFARRVPDECGLRCFLENRAEYLKYLDTAEECAIVGL